MFRTAFQSLIALLAGPTIVLVSNTLLAAGDAVSGGGGSGGDSLFPVGQVDPITMAGMGFTGWYAWYVTAKLIPKQTNQFREDVKEAYAKYDASLKETQITFKESLEAERAHYRAELAEARRFHSEQINVLAQALSLQTNKSHA